MNIGYACQIAGRPDLKITSCRLKNATDARLRGIITSNLSALEKMIEYNITRGIRLFRISSDIIPFATHPINTIDWQTDYRNDFSRIGKKIKKTGMRVSMHPGQYCVLNSPDTCVVRNAISELNYHAAFLDALGVDGQHKIILHVGGVYGDKSAAIQRFTDHYDRLCDGVKRRLVIENDERSYHVCNVLDIARELHIPCVFDNLHHAINAPRMQKTTAEWIKKCGATWTEADGPQKIHYSEQAMGKKMGAHSDTIDHRQFCSLVKQLYSDRIDVMIEVKDKNISALKCITLTQKSYQAKVLEAEWARYKYLVLSRSKQSYDAVRNLLKDKKTDLSLQFYDMIAVALKTPASAGQAVVAAEHVWGHLKKLANPAEKAAVMLSIRRLNRNIKNEDKVKLRLHKLSVKYNIKYLLESYYFISMTE